MTKIENEQKLISKMILIYCGKHHGTPLCEPCAKLTAYAKTRLTVCRYGAQKSPCKTCPTHCYAPHPREEIRKIMRQIAPLMLLRMPLSTIRHLIGF